MDNDDIHLVPTSFFLAPPVGSIRTTCGIYLYRPSEEIVTDLWIDTTCVHCRNAA